MKGDVSFQLFFNKVFRQLSYGDLLPATIKTFFFGYAIGLKGAIALLLRDTLLATNLQRSVANLRQASEYLAAAGAQLQAMAGEVEEGPGLLNQLLYDTTVVATLKAVMEGLDSGRGTAGLLLKDSAAANDIRQILDNLNQGTARFNENMEAMKENFLFRRYFKKKKKEGAGVPP